MEFLFGVESHSWPWGGVKIWGVEFCFWGWNSVLGGILDFGCEVRFLGVEFSYQSVPTLAFNRGQGVAGCRIRLLLTSRGAGLEP